jgi:excisionase family DNA binding protein
MISARRTHLPHASRGGDPHGANDPVDAIDVLMTVPEVAEFLRTSPKAVYCMVERNQLPVVRFNRRVLVDREVLLEWLRRKSTPSLEQDGQG